MGCDIHGIVQYRRSKDSTYQFACSIEDGRNYAVFAMLAGVRNVFSQIVDGDPQPLEPISMPRGLPEDLALIPELMKEGDHCVFSDKDLGQVYLGAHSFSWLTIGEILSWQGWQRDLGLNYIIDRKEYERIKSEGGVPQSAFTYVGGTGNAVVKVIDENEVGTVEDYTHVNYRWREPFLASTIVYWKWFDYIDTKFTRYLKDDPGAVRIIIGFDN